AFFYLHQCQGSIAWVRDHSKVRPYGTIKKIPLDLLYYRSRADHIHFVTLTMCYYVVNKKGDAPYVIEMSMSNKDMPYHELLLHIKDIGQTAGIEEDVIIKKKPRGIMAWNLGAGTAKNSYFHRRLLILIIPHRL